MSRVGTRRKHEAMKAVAVRDGWVCHYCGVKLLPVDLIPLFLSNGCVDIGGRKIAYYGDSFRRVFMLPTIDHKVPVVNGGTDDIDNKVLACHSCNARKGHRVPYDVFVRRFDGDRA